jgi:hypothetical protein
MKIAFKLSTPEAKNSNQMKYYCIEPATKDKPGECVLPTMEMPLFNREYFSTSDFREYDQNLANWEMWDKHIASLPKFPTSCDRVGWFRGAEQCQHYNDAYGVWNNCDEQRMLMSPFNERRKFIVPQSEEKDLAPEEKDVPGSAKIGSPVASHSSTKESLMSKRVTRTERGWAGHFICSHDCLFRRNTLLECDDIKIVVSTVGGMRHRETIETIGYERYYETMAFHADPSDTRYHDIAVSHQVEFESPWAIDHTDADDEANDMHEVVVSELEGKLCRGEISQMISEQEPEECDARDDDSSNADDKQQNPVEQKDEPKDGLTVRKYMLKRFPTDEFMDCPVPKEYWTVIQDYAEAYHASKVEPQPAPKTYTESEVREIVGRTWEDLWSDWVEYVDSRGGGSGKYAGQFLEWMKRNYENPVKRGKEDFPSGR